MPAPIPPLFISLSRGVLSSMPSTHSPVPSTGKDMKALIAAQHNEMEEEKRRKAGKDQAKLKTGPGKQKAAAKPSCSSESSHSSSSEGEQPPVKASVTSKGK